MAGLVGYASSDEASEPEEVQESPRAAKTEARNEAAVPSQPQPSEPQPSQPQPSQPAESPRIAEAEEKTTAQEPEPAPGPVPEPAPPQNVVIGPSRPAPADVAAVSALDNDDDDDDDDTAMADAVNDDRLANGEPPLSPYSAERAAVRQLTMPRVPDFDIPAGDDDDDDGGGADAAAADALNKKFATFLELKQKKDTHFNARLAQSDAMKNPALMDKLMAFVGLPGGASAEEDATATAAVDTGTAAAPYRTTLPADIWDPTAFPAEAYRRSLRRLQDEAAKQRARAPGQPVDFVAATAAAGTLSASIAAGAKRKTRFD